MIQVHTALRRLAASPAFAGADDATRLALAVAVRKTRARNIRRLIALSRA